MKKLSIILTTMILLIDLIKMHQNTPSFIEKLPKDVREELEATRCNWNNLGIRPEKIDVDAEPKNLDSDGKRILADESWIPFKIEIDYSLLTQYKADNPSMSDKVDSIKLKLESIAKYFEKYVQVYAKDQLYFGSGNSCRDMPIPEEVDAALHLSINPQNEADSDTIASAAACFVNSNTGRPVAGFVNVNFANIGSEDYQKSGNFLTVLHEIFHVIGFSSNFFEEFRDSSYNKRPSSDVLGSMTIGSTSFTSVVMETALDEAKSFFSCDSITGLPLENDGGSGTASSHWEVTYFPNELMSPFGGLPTYLSSISLATLEYSSWYKMDRAMAQNLVWGKGDGCDHFTVCPGTDEYCSDEGSLSCSQDFTSKTTCYNLGAPDCPFHRTNNKDSCITGIFDQNSNQDIEKMGPGSSCFMRSSSSLSVDVPSCFESSCESGKVKFKIASGDEFTCNSSGERISVGDGVEVICPDSTKFCESQKTRCPNDCSNNGICLVNQKCFCYAGNGGETCEGDEEDDDSDGGLSSGGLIAIIVVAVFCGVLILCAIGIGIAFFKGGKSKTKKRYKKSNQKSNNQSKFYFYIRYCFSKLISNSY